MYNSAVCAIFKHVSNLNTFSDPLDFWLKVDSRIYLCIKMRKKPKGQLSIGNVVDLAYNNEKIYWIFSYKLNISTISNG
jgi:hypothetical protein